MSRANTIGILLPEPSTPAAVSIESANPPAPLENAAGPVEIIEAVANVAAEALTLSDPEAAEAASLASDILSLADMIPGTTGPKPPSKKTVHAFGGGTSGGMDGGQSSGHGKCIPCKLTAAVGMPVNAILGIKILSGDTETDFVLDSPVPLVWQRSYYSDQQGNGWLGQGWSLPFSLTLQRTDDG